MKSSQFLKKICAVVLSVAVVGGSAMAALPAIGVDSSIAVSAAAKSVTDYTYIITPILSPFNEYFFVKTDNPDPTSFRFADKSSVYDKDSTISFDWEDWNEKVTLYADIKYEDEETGRVNGGYIFKSFNTDGGEIVLQSRNETYYSWDATWNDTNVKLTLPTLKDDVDYLIDTYANKSGFFENMDAVQSGFSSICLYDGSYIRGELYKAGSFWGISTSPHKDQTFYIQSPYRRKNSKSLFASVIYPYRYDSLGFPSVMGAVSKRLDSSSSYQWNSSYHYIVDVTHDGETRTYGGQGSGEGQSISEDKIKQYFTFGTNGTKITLENTRRLLEDYAAVEMEDDVPRKDALTWKNLYDTVGSEGTWVRVMDGAYTYLYQKGDGTYYWTDVVGDDGTEIYWSGNLGYVSDTWIDGRYIDSWEEFIKGEKFEDHPTSNIMMKQVKVPLITCEIVYRYNDSANRYEKDYSNIEITENQENVLFRYDTENDIWTAEYDELGNGYCEYNDIVIMTQKGLIDEKYLDMVTLTRDEAKALNVDKNTNSTPDKGFVYDGTVEPGTPYAYVPETGVRLDTTSITLEKGQFGLIIATVLPVNATGTDQSVIWSSSNEKVATVDNGGWITAIGPGTATITAKTSNGKTATCVVTVKSPTVAIKTVTLKMTPYTYDGKEKKPTVTVKDVDDKTVASSNYTVKYIDNTKAGTAKVIVTGKGNYTGTITKTFKINAKSTSKLTTKLSSTSYVYNNKAQTPNVTVKDGKTTLKKGTDYTVTYSKNKAIGTAKVTIKGKGNYTGTITKTFKIVPKTPTLKTVTSPKTKQLKATWTKDKTVTGYQIQYSTSSKFTSGNKTNTISKNSTTSATITKLTKGKTYYVRVRAYKTVSGQKVYGAYSTAKKVKIK